MPSLLAKLPGMSAVCWGKRWARAIPPSTSRRSAAACPESASLNRLGITAVTMPSGFVYVNAVDSTHAPNLAPSSQQLGVFITGVPRYRASVPYLAYSTAANLADPSQWMFFNGLSRNAPNWISRTAWESKHNSAGRWVPRPVPRSSIPQPPRSASASTRSLGSAAQCLASPL
jgi:hypothetical protein